MGKLPRWPQRPPQARLKDGAHGVMEESREVWLSPGQHRAGQLEEGGSEQKPPAGILAQQSKPRRPSWNSRSEDMTGELLQRKALGPRVCIANPILFPNSLSWDWNKELTLSFSPCLLPSCHEIWPCCHHTVLLNSQARWPSLLSHLWPLASCQRWKGQVFLGRGEDLISSSSAGWLQGGNCEVPQHDRCHLWWRRRKRICLQWGRPRFDPCVGKIP